MAKKKNALDELIDEAGGPDSGGTHRTAKILLILFFALDVVAAGTYGYFELFLYDDVERTLKNNQRNVVRARQRMKDLNGVVNTIRENKLHPIKDPGTLILELAKSMGLQEKISVDRPTVSRWKGGNYQEKTVRVNFREKEGYKFEDLIKFLESIERRNPKLLIKEMNFGKRDEADAEDTWRPHGPALHVRTFHLDQGSRR